MFLKIKMVFDWVLFKVFEMVSKIYWVFEMNFIVLLKVWMVLVVLLGILILNFFLNVIISLIVLRLFVFKLLMNDVFFVILFFLIFRWLIMILCIWFVMLFIFFFLVFKGVCLLFCCLCGWFSCFLGLSFMLVEMWC